MIDAARRLLRKIRPRRRPREERITLRIEPLESERGFRLSGELDIYTYEMLRDALEPELHGTVILDVAGVYFTDESGLSILVRTTRRLHEQGGSLVLRNPSAHVQKILDMTGVARMPGLTIEPEP